MEKKRIQKQKFKEEQRKVDQLKAEIELLQK